MASIAAQQLNSSNNIANDTNDAPSRAETRANSKSKYVLNKNSAKIHATKKNL